MNNVQKKIEDMAPNEWLDYMRKKHGLNNKYDLPDNWLEDFLQRLPSTERKKAKKIWLERRNKISPIIHDEMIDTYLKQIKPILNPIEKEITDKTFFGIMPTYQFNAYAGFTPKGDRTVILHFALVHTLGFWTHVYVRSWEEKNWDFFTDSNLYNSLNYIIHSWQGLPYNNKLPDIYPKTKDSWDLDQCLVMSAISFIIGHEIGHVLHDHRGYGTDRIKNHKMEYDADRCGLSIMLRHSLVKTLAIKGDTYHTKFMLLGPFLALAVCSLFNNHSSDTHPSPSDRCKNLHTIYRQELSNILGIFLNDFLDDIDHDVFDVLSNNTHTLFHMFGIFRDIIKEIKSLIPKPNASWIEYELSKVSNWRVT